MKVICSSLKSIAAKIIYALSAAKLVKSSWSFRDK